MQLRLPSNWGTFSGYQKACYLCNTRQANDFKEAYSILRSFVKPKPKPQPPAPIRQYKDDLFD